MTLMQTPLPISSCYHPTALIDIPQNKVNFVVELPGIGDAVGISSGTTRPATDGPSLAIALPPM